MSSAQSIQIYEILAARFGNTEEARKVVEAIEKVVDERTTEKVTAFESLNKKDFELVRTEARETASRLEAKIAESQSSTLRWLFGFFVTLVLMIVGLYFKK